MLWVVRQDSNYYESKRQMALEINYEDLLNILTRDNCYGKVEKRKINGESVENIIPIGNNCTLAFILKRLGLKKTSYPFDWNFSTPESVLHCIEDKFSSFLNKDFFLSKYDGEGKQKADNIFYKENFGISDFYTHRDPTIVEDYEYFRRTVDRFNRTILSKSTKLFISMSRPHVDAISNFQKMHNMLNKLTENFNYISIQLDQSKEKFGDFSMENIRDIGPSRLYRFRPQFGECDGFEFPCLSDEMVVSSLICEYEFSASYRPA